MASPVRSVLTEYDLGRGWGALHTLALQRGRSPSAQVKHLVLLGLDRYLAGEEVELSSAALQALLTLDDELEPVA